MEKTFIVKVKFDEQTLKDNYYEENGVDIWDDEELTKADEDLYAELDSCCDIEDLEEILDTYNTSYWVTTELVD